MQNRKVYESYNGETLSSDASILFPLFMMRLFVSLLAVAANAQLIFKPQNADHGGSNPISVPINISSLFDNRAFAMRPGDANFDQHGSGYPAEYIPPVTFVYAAVNFSFPQYRASGNDNVISVGQVIQVPQGRYSSVKFLGASDSAQATGFINATYSDGSTTSSAILVQGFWSWPYPFGGDLIFPYYLSNTTIDYNRSNIFLQTNWLDSSKELVSLQLPNVTEGGDNSPGGASIGTRLHIFSLSLLPANATDISLQVQYARSTQLWLEGTNKTQIVEVTVTNVGNAWLLANNSATVSIDSPGLETVAPAVINRLRPGDQITLRIGVINKAGVAQGSSGNASVKIDGSGISASNAYTFNATYGIIPYEATYESIYTHEAPQWYTSGKFGIFIHWGSKSSLSVHPVYDSKWF
jgi:alpha-L-fucosidase